LVESTSPKTAFALHIASLNDPTLADLGGLLSVAEGELGAPSTNKSPSPWLAFLPNAKL